MKRQLGLAAAAAALVAAAPPPSVPEVGSPELAALGPDAVGVMEREIVDAGQVDPLASLATGKVEHADRHLPLVIWYPAKAAPDAARPDYGATLVSEPPRPPVRFTVPALAVPDAAPAGSGYPLVLLSHGYNNDPVMLSWLGENLASKGYVVVAIRHRDPDISDTAKAPATLLRRPLDIVFTLARLRAGLLGTLADTGRIALAGYSFGGYGVVTVGGAGLDPASPAVSRLPTPLVARYAGAGAGAKLLHDIGIRAIVAISPAGGAPWSTWGAGLGSVHAPLLVIAGTADRTLGYDPGPASVWREATGADRWLLAFKGAGHSIGTNPPPPEMRDRLWDFDWFADRVWRKERVNAVALHFITAFLDLHLKGDASRAAYFAVPAEDSDEGRWTGGEAPYDAVSTGGANATWKGFVRDHQDGLLLRHLPAVK